MLKLVERNSDTYKPIAGESLLALYLKTSVIRKTLLYWLYNIIYVYEKQDSWVMLEDFSYNKRFITY